MKRIILLLLSITIALASTASQFGSTLKALHNPTGKHVVVVAHRGDWRGAPENSLPAIEHCIDMGVDMVEIDLQKTLDGHLVLMHDFDVNRTSNGQGRVCDLTLEQIKSLRLKNGMGRVTTVQIPTIEEVFALTRGKILINIDKGYDYFPQVYALAREMDMLDQIVIKSGHRLDKVQRENADVLAHTIYMPVVNLNSDEAGVIIDEWLAVQPLAMECCFSQCGERELALMKKIQASGSKVWVNTLWPSLCAGHDDDVAVFGHNTRDSWQWVLDAGATLIQTDRPAMLINYLHKQGRH